VPRTTVWCSERLISFPDNFSHTEKKKSGNRTSDSSLVPRWDSSYGAGNEAMVKGYLGFIRIRDCV